MRNKYGEFPKTQFSSYKNYLHSKIHWLLIYKDPAFEDKYKDIDIELYIETLQRQIMGLNELLCYSPVVITLMALLESISILSKPDVFIFSKYRKAVLDAHRLVDEIV